MDEKQNNKVANGTNESCLGVVSENCTHDDQSESLKIIRELNEVYGNRMKDCEGAGDATEKEHKVDVLKNWVADLTEQNVMLVEVVENFEKEALYHLKVGYESQKLHDKELERLQQQVCCKNRIIETQQKALEDLRKSVSSDQDLADLCGSTDEQYPAGNCITCKTRGEKEAEPPAPRRMKSSEDLLLQTCNVQLQAAQKNLKETEVELEELKQKSSEDEYKIEKLNQQMINNEKSAREMRAALTAEVAEKHDHLLALRRDALHLEERLRQADMQTHFKDDIIKELRKEIKVANNKLAGQLRDKETMVSCLEERLEQLGRLPEELSPRLCQLKRRVAGLGELLGARLRSREEAKGDVQINVNSIMFNLNEAMILVDGFKDASDAPHHKTAVFDNRHKFTQNVSELFRNQMSCEKLLEELQYLKKFFEEEKLTMRTLDEEMQTLMANVSRRHQFTKEQDDIMQSLKAVLGHVEEHFMERVDHLDDKLDLWTKKLVESLGRVTNLVKQIQHEKETEGGTSNSHSVFKKKIHGLQEQLQACQQSKEKIYNKLCCFEHEQREHQKRLERALSMHKDTCGAEQPVCGAPAAPGLSHPDAVEKTMGGHANEQEDKISNSNGGKEEQYTVLNNNILNLPSSAKLVDIEVKMKNSLQEKVIGLEKKVLDLERVLDEKVEYIKFIKCAQKKLCSQTDKDRVTPNHDETIRKLSSDLCELNSQLQAREKIISNQQETIDLLQNSLQMEHSEMDSLKQKKEKGEKESRALQGKILLLETELKSAHGTAGGGAATSTAPPPNGSSSANKGWTPWSGKQAPPARRHVHDV